MEPASLPGSIYEDGQYLEKNRTWHSEDSHYKASLVCRAIRDNRLAFRDCADVGCGAGLVTELLAASFPDQQFVGIDPSRDVQAFWSDRMRRDNLGYSASNALTSGLTHDLVICLDVFEHVEDYFGFLRALRPTGRTFIFNIPLDMNVLKVLTPGITYAREELGHLHYFNEYTAVRTLEECGYEIVHTRLAAAYVSAWPRNLRQWLVLPLRLPALVLGKHLAARLLGGISLVVTARPRAEAGSCV